MKTALPHPESYTAYAFTERHGKLHKITVPWKDPEGDHIVVKVLACGVCGSDECVPDSDMPIQFPRIPGHEIVGDVVAISPGEETWKLGQRVGAGWHGGHCRKCRSCRVGEYATCEQVVMNGILRDGGYAEFVTLRSDAVVAVPEDMDPVQAAPLLCAGMTCFNSLRHMDITPPEYVAVQGIGGLGHLGIQIARAMGFRVAALSSGPAKEAVARALGAHEYVDGSAGDPAQALRALGGAKVIMCTAPNAEATQKLVHGLACNGTLLLLAVEATPLVIPPMPMLDRRLSIRGWVCGSAKDSEDCLAFAQAHNIKCMVETFPLDKAQEAYDRRSSARFRAVIIPGV